MLQRKVTDSLHSSNLRLSVTWATTRSTVLPTSARTGSATDWCALLGNRLKCLKGAYNYMHNERHWQTWHLVSYSLNMTLFQWMILSVDITECEMTYKMPSQEFPTAFLDISRAGHKYKSTLMPIRTIIVHWGAVWESRRWTSWAVRPNEPSGFRGRKELLNRASALVTTCP